MQTLLQSLVILVGSAVLALGGMVLVRRSTPLSTLESHREIAGFVFATIGVIYAVLLAFVCVATWERFAQASDDEIHEANTIFSLYELAQAFSPPGSTLVDTALLRYTQVVVGDEWDQMARGLHSPQADIAQENLWAAYRHLSPVDRQEPGYGESLHQLTVLQEARGHRLDSADGQIPRIVWVVMIAGAAITIAFTYLFGVKSLTAQALITLALTIAVTGILVLTFALDDPYRGDVRVRPDALRAAEQLLVR